MFLSLNKMAKVKKLNPIFFMSDADMQEKFHVSMSDLVHVYGKQEGVTK